MSAMSTAQICALITVALALLVAAYLLGLAIGRRQQQAQQATIHLLTKALFDTSEDRDSWQQLAERRGDELFVARIHERAFEDDREIQP